MKKIICIFVIIIMAINPFMCKAIQVNVPVYMSLCGNDIVTDCRYTTVRVLDDEGNIIFDFLNYGNSNLNGFGCNIYNGLTYPTGTHAVHIGYASIDTEKTYHMHFGVSYYLQFTTAGNVHTNGFGIYFTTWEWPYNDYTLGEVAFGEPENIDSNYVYKIDYNTPGNVSVGYFCPDTDATGDLTKLKLFIDFGLGNPYYQLVYYAAGDYGF